MTEHELELVEKREKELKKSKDELQVPLMKYIGTFLVEWLNLKYPLIGIKTLLHKCIHYNIVPLLLLCNSCRDSLMMHRDKTKRQWRT